MDAQGYLTKVRLLSGNGIGTRTLAFWDPGEATSRLSILWIPSR